MTKRIIKLIGISLAIFLINIIVAYVIVVAIADLYIISLLENVLDFCIVIAMVIIDYIVLKKAYYGDNLKTKILGILSMSSDLYHAMTRDN